MAPEPGLSRIRSSLPSRWADAVVAAGIAAFAALVFSPGLDPPSLWRDDAWTALVIKADGPSETLLVGVTAPGFAILLKGWLGLVGFDEWKAQVLPLCFGVATPALVYLMLVRQGIRRIAAASGALLLIASPELLQHATRVKQFSLDALVAAGLLALGWRLLQNPASRRRWWALTLGGVAGLVLSSPSAVVLTAGLGVGLLALRRDHTSRLRVALMPVVVATGFALAWWALVLRPAVSPALELYWDDFYVHLDRGPGEAVESAGLALGRFLAKATPLDVVGALILLAALAVAVRRDRLLGLLLVSPVAIAFVLAALAIAPLGTGRTDAYLYPALAVAAALALDSLAQLALPAGAGGAVALAGAVAVFASPAAYPVDDVKPLVARVEAQAGGDAIVAYPLAAYAFALYTTLPIDFVERDDAATGFHVRVLCDNVFVDGESWPYDPPRFEATVERVRRGRERAWVITAPTDEPVEGESTQRIEQFVAKVLRGKGFRRSRTILRSESATLDVWETAGSRPASSRSRTCRPHRD